MPLYCSSLRTQVPCVPKHTVRYFNKFLSPNYVGFKGFSLFFCVPQSERQHKVAHPIVSLSKFDRNYSSSASASASSIMADQKRMDFVSSMESKYSKELDVAVRVVQMACFLCQKVQESLISKSSSQVQSKDDNSPVTIAGILFTLSCLLFYSSTGFFLWSSFWLIWNLFSGGYR